MNQLHYLKEVRWSDEDDCFIGSIPDVCGDCCHGDTQLEVYAQLIDIESSWRETWKADGKTPPVARKRRPLVKRFAPQRAKNLNVRKVRESLGMSQVEFAGFLGISVRTLHKWESLASSPSGAARSLLQIAAKCPEAIAIGRS